MLPESAKRLREPIAALLLGATMLYLIVRFAQLFKDTGTGFSIRAMELHLAFVDPTWILVVVLAALLVTSIGERTARARLIVLAAMALLAVMALLAIITWLASLGADYDSSYDGKLAGSFLFLAGLAVLASGLLLTYLLFKSLPAPVRQKPAPQQWGGQGQQWGGAPPQQQWAPQPQQQWGDTQSPPPGSPASWTAPGVGQQQPPPPQPTQPPQSWGQQPPPQQAWGQQAPHPPAGPSEPPAGAGGATAVPQPDGRPEGDTTAVWNAPPPEPGTSQGTSQAPRRDEENDSRPGWWNPGS